MAPIDILDDKTHITADRASSDDFAFSGSHRDSNDNSHHTTDQPFSQNENGFEFNDSHGHDAGANNHASTLYRRSGNSKGRDTGQYSKKTENVYDRNSADSAADISRSNSASEETSRSYHNTNRYTEKDNRNVQGSNIENHGTYNENHDLLGNGLVPSPAQRWPASSSYSVGERTQTAWDNFWALGSHNGMGGNISR
ncbi:hypothetical protein K435DRAFT_842765 [Dendrothele bispora CBS 962.96]|uniref:Uncharacterized protein n=1 Tax=Dendrothele bispora (strain CBS 962.96) TaxID=1314807 RepID=A0A4S8LDR2_DENBC|nr:hypothetical protein K435DRAFT_842765 [Dendrothele bispora CBS 962.96]